MPTSNLNDSAILQYAPPAASAAEPSAIGTAYTVVDISSGSVTATSTAEEFRYDFQMLAGRATKASDGEVSISGFDVSQDKLVFVNTSDQLVYTEAEFKILPGVLIGGNPFTSKTTVYFDSSGQANGGVTLEGILDTALAQVVLETMSASSGTAPASYTLAAGAAKYDEGVSGSFTLTTTNVADGTVLNYTLSGTGITPSDITGGALYGTVTVQNNTASISVPLAADSLTEGAETLNASILGTGATASFAINDTSVASTSFTVVDLSSGSVTATAAAEEFRFDYQMLWGRATKAGDGEVTINGFDPSKDKLVFVDTTNNTVYTEEEFKALEGVFIGADPFSGSTTIYFDPYNGAAGGVTLTGIQDPDLAQIVLNDAPTPIVVKSYTVPGTLGNDFFLPSGGNNYLGGGGSDTYIISPYTLSGAVTAKITDTEGANIIQLVDGLTIASSSFYGNAVQLTLSNGATVQILGAAAFTYLVGANAPAGDTTSSQTYAQFAATLGTSVPTGSTPVSGTANFVVPSIATPASVPTPATAGTAATVPGTLGNDFFLPSGGNNYLGGGGSDTYIISPYTLSGAVTAKITDTEGANVIQLVDGLTIASSSFYGNAVQLTLSNGANVQILGAAAFSYQVGANAPAGDTASSQTYAQFAATLGASVPTGSTPVSGTANFVVPTSASAGIALADEGGSGSGSGNGVGVGVGVDVALIGIGDTWELTL